MLKKNKLTLILSSVVILLPILAGLLLWEHLPQELPTHWNINGSVDDYSSKGFAVFVLPLILLGFHWICTLATALDRKNKDQQAKLFTLVFWIIPALSLMVSGLIYATALGMTLDITAIIFCFMGLLFIVIGNYLPKCKQNRTLGIKVKWTLENEANWNATHRMAGKLWVAGGLLFLLIGFLPSTITLWAMPVLIGIMVIVPVIYSYALYKRA